MKIRAAVFLAMITASLAIPGTTRAAFAQTEAMFRGDAAHQGVYSSRAPTLKTVRWRFTTGGRIVSSPTVAAGIVYVGSYDGQLYAVRANAGSLLWKFQTKGPVNSSAAVWNGAVFFSSVDGNVYAVKTTTGSEIWRFKTGGERRFTAAGIHGIIPRAEVMPDPFDVFLSSPAVSNGVVYVASGDGTIYAIDAATGTLRWKFATGNVVHASPAVSGATVYVGSWDRYFYAFDARTGALRWKFETGDDETIHNLVGIPSSASIANGIVYFGCRDGFFYALDAAHGRLLWKHNDRGSWVVASPAVAQGKVFFTTSDERKFFALDGLTGKPQFAVPYPTFSFSSPSIAGEVAYFGSFDGNLYGVNITTGKIVSRFQTDASKRYLPTYADAKGKLDLSAVYRYGTLDGIIAGLDRLYALGALVGSPAIVDGTLYIGSGDGTLYALT